MSDLLRVAYVTRRLVRPFVLVRQLNDRREPRTGPAVQALAAQAGRVQLASLVRRRYQKTLRRLGRLERVSADRARRRVRGTTAGAGLPLHGADGRFRPAVRAFTWPFRAMGLDGRSVQITVAEAVSPEGLGGQIVPGLRLGVLKARRWSLVHAGVPVEGVGAEAGRTGSDAVSRR